jgi:hypothetical protein
MHGGDLGLGIGDGPIMSSSTEQTGSLGFLVRLKNIVKVAKMKLYRSLTSKE